MMNKGQNQTGTMQVTDVVYHGEVGEVYRRVAKEYLRIAGVALPKARGAVDDLVKYFASQGRLSVFEDVEELLGIRPYIEAALIAMDDVVERMQVLRHIPQDYLKHVLYGEELKPVDEAHSITSLSTNSNVILALRATEAVHRAMVQDIAYEYLLEVPAAQVLALPFELIGVQHLQRVFSIVEPIFEDLGVLISGVMLERAYKEQIRSGVPALLQKGQDAIKRVTLSKDQQGSVSDLEALKMAILATPTGNKAFDRFIHADERIMTDRSRRLKQAQTALAGMIQQAVALTPELGIDLP